MHAIKTNRSSKEQSWTAISQILFKQKHNDSKYDDKHPQELALAVRQLLVAVGCA